MEGLKTLKWADDRQTCIEADRLIEAVQLTKENLEEVLEWSGGFEVEEIDALNHELKFVGLNVVTALGPRRCSEGEWLIKNKDGWFFVMKSDPLAFGYEPL
jgi:hypothetical protein